MKVRYDKETGKVNMTIIFFGEIIIKEFKNRAEFDDFLEALFIIFEEKKGEHLKEEEKLKELKNQVE